MRGHWRVLKTCCRWLVEEERIERDPFSGRGKVPTPSMRRRRVRAWSDPEIARLLSVTALPSWKRERRTNRQQWQAGGPLELEMLQARSLVLLLADSGLRAGEVCSLTCGDVRAAEIVVIGKGGHEGVAHVSQMTRELLVMLASDRPDDAPLFRDWTGKPTTPRSLRGIVERLADRAGIGNPPPRILHAFRHYAVRRWLASGVPTLMIKQLMRHQALATTEIYTELDSAALAKIHERASPVAGLIALAGLDD